MDFSPTGGVLQPQADAEAFAFGFFLDYLSGLLLLMVGGYGLLLTEESERSRVFDDAFARLERKRTTARSLMQTTCSDGS